MKPVDQTITGDRGDCFRACLASILEVPTLDVPHFFDEAEDMHAATIQWLAPKGIAFLAMYFLNPTVLQSTHFDFSMYCILGGYGPRKNERGDYRMHAVVARTLPWGVEIVHDPHPDRSGLLNWGHRWVKFVVFPPNVELHSGTSGLRVQPGL